MNMGHLYKVCLWYEEKKEKFWGKNGKCLGVLFLVLYSEKYNMNQNMNAIENMF